MTAADLSPELLLMIFQHLENPLPLLWVSRAWRSVALDRALYAPNAAAVSPRVGTTRYWSITDALVLANAMEAPLPSSSGVDVAVPETDIELFVKAARNRWSFARLGNVVRTFLHAQFDIFSASAYLPIISSGRLQRLHLSFNGWGDGAAEGLTNAESAAALVGFYVRCLDMRASVSEVVFALPEFAATDGPDEPACTAVLAAFALARDKLTLIYPAREGAVFALVDAHPLPVFPSTLRHIAIFADDGESSSGSLLGFSDIHFGVFCAANFPHLEVLDFPSIGEAELFIEDTDIDGTVTPPNLRELRLRYEAEYPLLLTYPSLTKLTVCQYLAQYVTASFDANPPPVTAQRAPRLTEVVHEIGAATEEDLEALDAEETPRLEWWVPAMRTTPTLQCVTMSERLRVDPSGWKADHGFTVFSHLPFPTNGVEVTHVLPGEADLTLRITPLAAAPGEARASYTLTRTD